MFSSADLLSTDSADGSTDGVVDLARLVGEPSSWKLRTEPAVPVGDTDGNGGDNLLAWGTSYGLRMAFLFSPGTLAVADAVHVLNGFVSSNELYVSGAAKRIFGAWPLAQVGASTAGDVDGDGDGISDVSDPDDDNDGTPDIDDPCPLDSGDSCDDASGVASLEVSGMTPLTSIGQTIQLAATAHMLNGSSQAIASESAHWVSADSAVATVIDGTVTATGGGNARIVATYRGHKAVVEISVRISVRETGTVRVIYAVPSDRAFRSDYRDAVGHAVVDLQHDGFAVSPYDSAVRIGDDVRCTDWVNPPVHNLPITQDRHHRVALSLHPVPSFVAWSPSEIACSLVPFPGGRSVLLGVFH